MRTTRLGIAELASGPLSSDLKGADEFTYNDAYSDFVIGDWRSCMLWNNSGEAADAKLSGGQYPARITAFGEAMPYLRSVLERTFRLDHLRFGRLARMMPGTVLVPHRDFLELNEGFIRIHVPLATNRLCLNAEENQAFHMATGEIWFLDARQLHSAASAWDRPRIHLILDFCLKDSPLDILHNPSQATSGIPEDAIMARPPLTPSEQAAIAALGDLVDRYNYRDILAVLIRKAFTRDLPLQSVFDQLELMAERSGDPDLIDTLKRERLYFTIARS